MSIFTTLNVVRTGRGEIISCDVKIIKHVFDVFYNFQNFSFQKYEQINGVLRERSPKLINSIINV